MAEDSDRKKCNDLVHDLNHDLQLAILQVESLLASDDMAEIKSGLKAIRSAIENAASKSRILPGRCK